MAPSIHLLSPFSATSFVPRWMAGLNVSMATIVLSCFLLMLNPLLVPCAMKNSTASTSVECILGNDTTCPSLHCCVKKVVIYRDSRTPEVGTRCEPLLQEREPCLRNGEGYFCTCLPDLACQPASKFENAGFCKPRRWPRARH